MASQEIALNASSDIRSRRVELEEQAKSQKVLNTPRTKEACRRLGLVVEDLEFRTFDAFYIPGDHKEKQSMRFERAEKKRRERLGQVLAERAKCIAQDAKKGEVPGVQSAQFLCMLESLFEKEAKRLETDLKDQLRQHSSLVRENDEQLKKEEFVQAQHEKRLIQRADAESKVNEETSKKRVQNLERQQKNDEAVAKNLADWNEKQRQHEENVKAEDMRMEKFSEDVAQRNSDKSAFYKAKTEGMKLKNMQVQNERRLNGESRLAELDERLLEVQNRREGLMHEQALASEKRHLDLMDVRSQKDRIDRVDGYRREELREQLDSNVERIETLLALKDQLLDQRKARSTKAEATRGSRGMNLRRDCLPGPGQYETPASCLEEARVNSFPQGGAGHSEFIDAITRVTSKNPAPGSYATHILPNGGRLDVPTVYAKIGSTKRDTYLDDAMRDKAFVPAPGRYEGKNQLDHRGIKMRRDAVPMDNLDKHDAKRFPVWARQGTATPGPAGYSVDDYTRKEVLRRAQRSLPNLTRDMLRPTDKIRAGSADRNTK